MMMGLSERKTKPARGPIRSLDRLEKVVSAHDSVKVFSIVRIQVVEHRKDNR
jgi:hypothetical protein